MLKTRFFQDQVLGSLVLSTKKIDPLQRAYGEIA